MTTPSLQHFGQEHFGAAELGDVRRTRSLVALADRFVQHPGGSLPQKCQDPNTLRRCYDLMNARQVTHRRVLAPHQQRTLGLCFSQPVVLCLHDGTELDFSGLTSLHDDLGQIGNGFGRGYVVLNSLAVVPGARTVLGLLAQQLHRRVEGLQHETRVQRRERENRESLLWLKAVADLETATDRCRCRLGLDAASQAPLWVDVCDRGGDTFEFVDQEDLVQRHYVVRSNHDRCCRVGHADGSDAAGAAARTTTAAKRTKTRLHRHLRTLPAQDRQTRTIPGRDGRPPRQATLAIAWAAVTLLPPRNRSGHDRRQPLRVWAIRVWEEVPPTDGSEPVEWFLLTNLAVTTAAQAWEKVDWYCHRWIIEEFHKAQKTGCDIESPQLTHVDRLQPLIALLSVVATALLTLRDLSRDTTTAALPATTVVAEEYVQVLSGWRYQEQRPLSVGEFLQALARLGGHQNRKRDRAPGWLVLWRGWQALQLMVAGARAIQRPQAARPAGAAATAATQTAQGTS
jgi:hypothetical protein